MYIYIILNVYIIYIIYIVYTQWNVSFKRYLKGSVDESERLHESRYEFYTFFFRVTVDLNFGAIKSHLEDAGGIDLGYLNMKHED